MEHSEIKKLELVFNKIYVNAKLNELENDWMRNISQNIDALKNYHNIE